MNSEKLASSSIQKKAVKFSKMNDVQIVIWDGPILY